MTNEATDETVGEAIPETPTNISNRSKSPDAELAGVAFAAAFLGLIVANAFPNVVGLVLGFLLQSAGFAAWRVDR